jgi:hypothetical protein
MIKKLTNVLILLIIFLSGCSSCNTSDNTSVSKVPEDTILQTLRELDYQAAVEGDTTLLDSAYQIIINYDLINVIRCVDNKYKIVLSILAKKGKWKEVIQILEPYKKDLNDTMLINFNYYKYKYSLSIVDSVQAYKYLQKNIDILSNKLEMYKGEEAFFWLYEKANQTYLLHGTDSTLSYLNTVDSSYLKIINININKAIEVLLQNIKEQNEQ